MHHRGRGSLFGFGLVVVLGGASGCKTDSGAKLRESDAAPVPACGGAGEGIGAAAGKVDVSALGPDAQAGASAALDRALTSVPDAQKRALFAFASLRVVPRLTSTECAGNFPAAAMGKGAALGFCWTFEQGRMVALVNGESAALEHAVVRVFALAAFDVAVPVIDHWTVAQRTANPKVVEAAGFLRKRAVEVAQAYGEAAGGKAATQLKNVKNGGAQVFVARVALADAFDRKTCSDATRAGFAARFPKALAAYDGAQGRSNVADALTTVYAAIHP